MTFDDPEDSPQNVKPIYTPSGTKAHTPSPSTLLEQEQNQPLSALLAGSISAAPRRWSDSDIYTGLLKFVSSSPAGDAKERESEGGRRERKADVRERGGGEAERMRVLVLELARAKLCLRISNDSEEKLVQMLKQERKNAQLLVEKVRRQSKEDMVALEQEVHTLLQQMEAQVTEERARARRQAQELSGLQGCIAELRESNCTAHTSVNSRLLCERAWRGWSELWATSSERRHVILTCVRSRARRRQLEHAMDTWAIQLEKPSAGPGEGGSPGGVGGGSSVNGAKGGAGGGEERLGGGKSESPGGKVTGGKVPVRTGRVTMC